MRKTPLASIALLALVVAASPLAAQAEDSLDTSASTNIEVSGGNDQKPVRTGFFSDMKLRLEGHSDKKQEGQKDGALRNGEDRPERDATTTRQKPEGIGGDIVAVKARATKQIDERIVRLNAQIGRIGSMERLSTDQKASITAELSAQVTELVALKAKIVAETEIAAVREDLKSITKSFRVYMVTMPKAAITAAADRIMAIVAKMETFSDKLSARVTASGSAEASAAFSDFGLKIADAKIQAQAAASLVAGLQADNGDEAAAASNLAALKSAKEKIDVGQADLKAARADIGIILKAIKGKDEGSDS